MQKQILLPHLQEVILHSLLITRANIINSIIKKQSPYNTPLVLQKLEARKQLLRNDSIMVHRSFLTPKQFLYSTLLILWLSFFPEAVRALEIEVKH